ncbi:MAG: hypothetical protein ACXAD7_27045 [Candidatus Kariarchaeaceae archaeon]|jgi:hypothetical protein
MRKNIWYQITLLFLIFFTPFETNNFTLQVSASPTIKILKEIPVVLPIDFEIRDRLVISNDSFIVAGRAPDPQNPNVTYFAWAQMYQDDELIWELKLGNERPYYDKLLVRYNHFEFNSIGTYGDKIFLYGTAYTSKGSVSLLAESTILGGELSTDIEEKNSAQFNDVGLEIHSKRRNFTDRIFNETDGSIESVYIEVSTNYFLEKSYDSVLDQEFLSTYTIHTNVFGNGTVETETFFFDKSLITNSTWSTEFLTNSHGNTKVFFANAHGNLVTMNYLFGSYVEYEGTLLEKVRPDFALVELDVIEVNELYVLAELGFVDNTWLMYLNGYPIFTGPGFVDDLSERNWTLEIQPTPWRESFYLTSISDIVYLVYSDTSTNFYNLMIQEYNMSNSVLTSLKLDNYRAKSALSLMNQLIVLVINPDDESKLLYLQVSDINVSTLDSLINFVRDYPYFSLSFVILSIAITSFIIKRIRRKPKSSLLYPESSNDA